MDDMGIWHLDDWLLREDPDVSGMTADADADYAEAMEAIGVSDGDAADEAYNRLQRIEQRIEQRIQDYNAARVIIYRPLP